LRAGLNVYRGRITCEPVARALNLPGVSAESALGMA
jgi:alanine dehydrogenase